MRYAGMVLMLACIVAPLSAQEKTDEGPTNEKAQKTYKEGLDYLHQRMTGAALRASRKRTSRTAGIVWHARRR